MIGYYFLQTLRVGLGSDIPEVRSRCLAAVQDVRNGFGYRLNHNDVIMWYIIIITIL